jgi:hypothetical protein
MARVDGFEVDVPLLMIYWYSGTATPSTVIVLDSTVVFPLDMDDKQSCYAYQFDIRNARTVTTNATINRCFAAPKKARDAWMYAISQALLMYEKEHDRARKAALLASSEARRVNPLPLLSRSPTCVEVWNGGDRFGGSPNQRSLKSRVPSPPRLESPPTSPIPRSPRPASPTKRSKSNLC